MPKLAVVASAIGLMLLFTAAPAQAADKTLSVAYTCSGGPFSNTTLTVPIIVPDTASGSFEAQWGIPALTLGAAPTAATQVQVVGKLTVTGGTHTDLSATGASVPAGSATVPAGQVTSTVQVTAATGGQVTIKPSAETGSLKLSLVLTPTEVTTCTTTSTQSVTVAAGQDDGGEDGPGDGSGDVVDYTCRPVSGVTQSVRIRTTLTLPATSPKVGERFTIGWKGTYDSGADLEAPTGLPTSGLKMYAYASISGLPGLTSATGVGELTGGANGRPIALPASVAMKTTSQRAGTATVKPASVNFGLRPTEPLIECEPANSASLKTYPLTIGDGGSAPTPSPTPTESDEEETEEEPTQPTPRSSQTPQDGVATGAGGEAGPDGRMLVLTGSALVLLAGAGGLLRRRRKA